MGTSHDELHDIIYDQKEDIRLMLIVLSAYTEPETEGSKLLKKWKKKYN